MDAPSGQGNILVSAGVRVLKVPKRRVIELIPKGHMEVFQENFSPRHRSEPSNQAMFLKAPQMSRTSSKHYDNDKRGSIYVNLLKISIPASEDARPVLPGPNCPKVINASPVLVNKTTHMVYLQLRWDLPH